MAQAEDGARIEFVEWTSADRLQRIRATARMQRPRRVCEGTGVEGKLANETPVPDYRSTSVSSRCDPWSTTLGNERKAGETEEK